MRASQNRLRGLGVTGAVLIALAVYASPADAQTDPLADDLAKAFRMDLSEIEVTYDFFPERKRVQGEAQLTFEMRSGQTKPLFHFNPVRGAGEQELDSVELDGVPVAASEIDYIRPAKAAERGYEIDREVGAGEHTIDVSWSVPKAKPPQDRRWLFPNFDDTEGPDDETETNWPTVSSPEELATHVIHVNVHSTERYRVVGSGAVTSDPSIGDVQAWTVTTPATVSSSNVFFAAVPASEFKLDTIEVSGVEVEFLSNQKAKLRKEAKRIVRANIPRLIDLFGPFPVPKLSILLTGWGSGMEYYGATRTGVGALRHELGHMYFATTAINRTWRDTWLDEAIVSWWQAHGRLEPIEKSFKGNYLNRTAVEPGFNTGAYGRGARVLEAVAQSLGGDDEMFEFLTELHATREYDPFTTEDFIDDIVVAGSAIQRSKLERWMGVRR